MRCGERPRGYWRGPSTGSTVFWTEGPTGAGSDSLRSRVASTTLPTTFVGGGAAGGGGGAARGGGGAGALPPFVSGRRGGASPCGPPGARATPRPPGEFPGCGGAGPPEGGATPASAAFGAVEARVPEPRSRATTCAGPSDLLRGAGARSVLGREGPDAIWPREPRPPSAPPPAATSAAPPSRTRGAMSDAPAARAAWRPQFLTSFMRHPW